MFNLIRFQREPISLGAGTAIAAGVSALSAGGQIYAAGKMNRKTRQWNEMMYQKQREDALADWDRVNAYNSPEAQMARFKAAGLNPNLIYGQGTEASSPRQTDVKPWNPQTPDVSGLGTAAMQGLQAYQDYTLQQEQVKNMRAQRKNMEIESLLKSIEVSFGLTRNAKSELELDKARDLYDTSIEQAKEQLRGIKTSTDIKISQEARDAALHAPTLAAAIQRVANLGTQGHLAEQSLRNEKVKEELLKLEAAMRRKGITFSDPLILRVIVNALEHFAGKGSIPQMIQELWKKLREMGGYERPLLPGEKSNPPKDSIWTD